MIFAAILVIFFDEYSVEKDFGVADISCVIFDLDGTLAQTNPLIFASFNHVAERFLGKTLTPQEIVSLFGPPELGGLQKLLGNGTAGEAMNELCTYYRTHHSRLARLHEGIPQVLDLLRQRHTFVGLFTGKGHCTTRITLEAFGLLPYFDAIVTGDDVVRHKPRGEGILRILERSGARTEYTLMVGDSAADIMAAREAGVRVAAALWDAFDREHVLRAGPDLVFWSVREMHDWLEIHTNEQLDELLKE